MLVIFNQIEIFPFDIKIVKIKIINKKYLVL